MLRTRERGPNARAILCVGIVVAATPRRKGRGPVRRLSVRLYPDAAIPDAPGERQRGQAVPAVDDVVFRVNQTTFNRPRISTASSTPIREMD